MPEWIIQCPSPVALHWKKYFFIVENLSFARLADNLSILVYIFEQCRILPADPPAPGKDCPSDNNNTCPYDRNGSR